MNFELLNSLARLRRDELLREAAARRLLSHAIRYRRVRRRGLARRAFAAFAASLASALG